MSIRFNADEILQMAMAIETNGARFYRRAAEIVADEQARRRLLDLASAEDHHKEVFETMRAGLSAGEKGEAFVPPDEEISRYLAAWADGQVFDLSLIHI